MTELHPNSERLEFACERKGRNGVEKRRERVWPRKGRRGSDNIKKNGQTPIPGEGVRSAAQAKRKEIKCAASQKWERKKRRRVCGRGRWRRNLVSVRGSGKESGGGGKNLEPKVDFGRVERRRIWREKVGGGAKQAFFFYRKRETYRTRGDMIRGEFRKRKRKQSKKEG